MNDEHKPLMNDERKPSDYVRCFDTPTHVYAGRYFCERHANAARVADSLQGGRYPAPVPFNPFHPRTVYSQLARGEVVWEPEIYFPNEQASVAVTIGLLTRYGYNVIACVDQRHRVQFCYRAYPIYGEP